MMNQQKENYGIRKYAIGTSSVLLGATLFISYSSNASASEVETQKAQSFQMSNTEKNNERITTPTELTQETDTFTSKSDATIKNTTSLENSKENVTNPTISKNEKPTIPNKSLTNATSIEQKNNLELSDKTTPPKAFPESTVASNQTPVTTNNKASHQLNTRSIQTASPSETSAEVENTTNEQKKLTTQAASSAKSNNKAITTNDNARKIALETPSPNSKSKQESTVTTVVKLPREKNQVSQTQNNKTRAAVSQEDSTLDTLVSKDMVATIDKSFPAVKYYTLNNDKKVSGQVIDSRQIIINEEVITPTVHYQKTDEQTAQYELIAQNADRSINAQFNFRLSIINNTVDLQMTDYINHNTDPNLIIRNFGFINQSLVSINNQQTNATLQTSKMSTNTMKSGDKSYLVNDDFDSTFEDHMMYGFVSNTDYSAGLWSNAQISLGNGELDFLRVHANAVKTENGVSVGLGSMPWILQPSPKHQNAKEQNLLPHIRIAIAEDENRDGQINWQDGAIAYRDIMNNPYGYEEVPDLVGYRIAMNFGSHAQNPFLKTLDGVKKFYLNTDGLGQSILLKGYNSEGHDSAHLDYANIGKRMGGPKDFNALLEKGANYGARFGIHVNASETYPESKIFNPDLLKKNTNGTYSYGWNWLDQGFNIDADYDLTHGRKKRFQALKDIVGDRLDFIYVDVWGNGQSGDNTAWPSHQLAKELNDLGWRVGVEWGHGMEYDSTFQHWAADLTYGGYQNKGINSEVARFIRNHQKDSWVGNYPSYSGAADAPLLGGYDMKDFEGWQGRNDYESYIKNIFNVDLPTKFLQHYKVMRIEKGTPVTMTANNQTIEWVPEMVIDLQNDSGDNLIVKRKSNDYKNDIDNYRSRTIELNGQTILDGDTYLIPWNWDANGQKLTGDNVKLYHWNKEGGTSTWTLPDSWKTNQIVLYELTETGRLAPRHITVNNQQVTLDNIKAETPYVIYPTEQPDIAPVNWSEDMHIVDAGFNSQQLSAWTISGDTEKVSVAKSISSNDMLKFDSPSQTTQLTQKLTDLVPGQHYALYVGVDNRSNALTHIRVSHDGEILAHNQTGQSIAKNYVQADTHNTNKDSETYQNGGSYFQNMYLYFTAPTDGRVDFAIQRDAGEGETYLDDIRVVQNPSKLYHDGVFSQDFEQVPQGLFPFVVSEVEGVQDNRIHLSEKHAPYTQRGWNNKRVNDVIEGKWSLKVNGQAGKNKMVIQTIPQNFYFEPGVTYEVSFDYESGSDDTFAFATGSGDISKNREFSLTPLKNTIDQSGPQRITFRITGDANGQTWIGIYSTDVKADTRNVTDANQVNFEGTKDFILDNLVIRKIETTDTHQTSDTSNHNETPTESRPNKHLEDQDSMQTSAKNDTLTGTQQKDTNMLTSNHSPNIEEITAMKTSSQSMAVLDENQSTYDIMYTPETPIMVNSEISSRHMQTQPTQNNNLTSVDSTTLDELPKTGASSQNKYNPLIAIVLGVVMTLFGIRRQRKAK